MKKQQFWLQVMWAVVICGVIMLLAVWGSELLTRICLFTWAFTFAIGIIWKRWQAYQDSGQQRMEKMLRFLVKELEK